FPWTRTLSEPSFRFLKLQRKLNIGVKVLEQRDQVYEKISQYLQLKNTIQSLQEAGSQQLKADVDLGCNFFVQAHVNDSSRVFVAVGFGFFVEMTHDEALRFIDKKTTQLTVWVHHHHDVESDWLLSSSSLQGLRELQGLSDLPESQRRDVF
uniref:Ubiquitously-expressed, prefoldin-like chaperone n=1 Tax=Fundulus heteroclitus TaxID=8078 RepID=A0A3Q2QLF5_FUNHE